MSRLPDLSVRQGATLPLSLEVDDATASTATIYVKTTADAASATIPHTASFTGTDERVADLTLSAGATNVAEGEYVYQITIAYSDGVVEKYPDTANCEDEECAFPTLTICEALDPGVS